MITYLSDVPVENVGYLLEDENIPPVGAADIRLVARAVLFHKQSDLVKHKYIAVHIYIVCLMLSEVISCFSDFPPKFSFPSP